MNHYTYHITGTDGTHYGCRTTDQPLVNYVKGQMALRGMDDDPHYLAELLRSGRTVTFDGGDLYADIQVRVTSA